MLRCTISALIYRRGFWRASLAALLPAHRFARCLLRRAFGFGLDLALHLARFPAGRSAGQRFARGGYALAQLRDDLLGCVHEAGLDYAANPREDSDANYRWDVRPIY